jgi:hypothetical protein
MAEWRPNSCQDRHEAEAHRPRSAGTASTEDVEHPCLAKRLRTRSRLRHEFGRGAAALLAGPGIKDCFKERLEVR